VIGLKFPAYLIPHHTKVLWVLHQFRQAYDLRDRGASNIPETAAGEKTCELVRRADAEVFSTCRSIFTLSKVTQERLKRYNGVEAAVLMQPMSYPELFANCADSGYLFASGRINPDKRQHLLVEVMAAAKTGAKLIVADRGIRLMTPIACKIWLGALTLRNAWCSISASILLRRSPITSTTQERVRICLWMRTR
jgi:hypothetical protein